MLAQSTAIQAYQLRPGGTRARLSILRMEAIETAKAPLYAGTDRIKSWRDVRAYTLGGYASAFGHGLFGGSQGEGRAKTSIWYTHSGEYFRNETDAHEFSNDYGRRYIDHTGWYTDTEASEMAIGIVAQLPHGRYIAGYRWTSNDERVYFPEIFSGEDAQKEAARMADEHARVFAEDAREDAERFDAMQEIEGEIDDAREELREKLALRNHPKFSRAREEAKRLIARIRDKRETLQNDYSDLR